MSPARIAHRRLRLVSLPTFVLALTAAGLAAACATDGEASPPEHPHGPPAPPLHCKGEVRDNPLGSGAFGCWFADDAGLAAYEYTMGESDPRAKTFTKRDGEEGSTDHYHQIGNLRIKAMVHADGRVRFFDPTRGPKWVSEYSEHTVHVGGVEMRKNLRRRVFGMGYGRTVAEEGAVRATRTVYAPFGARAEDPVLIIEHTFENTGSAPTEVRVRELWDGAMHPLNIELTQAVRPDAADASRAEFMGQFLQSARYDAALGAVLIATAPKPEVTRPKREEAAAGDFYPGTLALALLDGEASAHAYAKRLACPAHPCPPVALKTRGKTTYRVSAPEFGLLPGDPPSMGGPLPATDKRFAAELTRTLTVAPGETARVRFAVAYADDAALGSLLGGLRATPPVFGDTSAAWDKAIPRLTLTGPTPLDDALTREIGWHGYHLLSSANFEEYFGVHTIDQGAAYGYLMGLRGAARDWLINAVAVLHLRPDLAREVIEFVMMTATEEKAKLSYGAGNFGQLADANIHTKPSDLDLWLLFAIVEYVEATRDFEFLRKPIAYYPRTAGKTATVEQRIARSLDWLTVEVGVGDHGMLKVGSGDWSDGIAFLAPSADVLHDKGESAFNTAFASYVFPRIAELVEPSNAPLAARFRTFATGFGEAMERSFSGKWYHRAWDGAGKPIGDDRMFLEHHAWVLVGATAPVERRASVITAIDENLSKGSPIGARVLFPYLSTAVFRPGWDVNGGVWSAMNGLLVWGLSRTDPARAWKELTDNSMARHAETYPNLWYGIWSGPDAYIAPEAERGGEAAFHLGTSLVDFPVTNSNRHALPLLDAVKLAGLEYTAAGLVVRPRLPFAGFGLETALAAVRYGADFAEGRTGFKAAGAVDVGLPPSIGDTVVATVNGAPVTTTATPGGVRFDVPAGAATWRVGRP